MYHRNQRQTQIHQTYRRENLIRPTTTIIKPKDTTKEELLETQETVTYKIVHKINGKVADDRV